ncbi:hypothetical protein LIN78_03565 [Leeia sp. TBRC 13508]|uniref:Uncharacterized protein n=1 Tax=Leeia speluncae TaxID=2884804 RepID=A0ABS8D378_9NEIS|nr:hypothetical protein [Leeia speluncae]MCB6182629.1 hypothetical protein [Leeia speluncae]
MKPIQWIATIVGIVQLVLGALYLLAPHQLLGWMGHSTVAADIAYPLGMLSARFLVYGVLMLVAAKQPAQHRSLLQGMIWIQVVDLAVGVFYTANGSVSWHLSAFPMFNAALIIGLLQLWMPKSAKTSPSLSQANA